MIGGKGIPLRDMNCLQRDALKRCARLIIKIDVDKYERFMYHLIEHYERG